MALDPLSKNSASTSVKESSVLKLMHWRDPKKSAVAFGLSLVVLVSLATFSVISVLSYLLLALLCVTITFRIYKAVIYAVQKSEEGHPFRSLMERDINISSEAFKKFMDVCLTYINHLTRESRRLLLVEDLIDSLKLAGVMWLMTYVGAVFNGITLLILADIAMFSTPLVYEKNKTQIDHYVDLIHSRVKETMAKLQDKLPAAIKRTKAE